MVRTLLLAIACSTAPIKLTAATAPIDQPIACPAPGLDTATRQERTDFANGIRRLPDGWDYRFLPIVLDFRIAVSERDAQAARTALVRLIAAGFANPNSGFVAESEAVIAQQENDLPSFAKAVEKHQGATQALRLSNDPLALQSSQMRLAGFLQILAEGHGGPKGMIILARAKIVARNAVSLAKRLEDETAIRKATSRLISIDASIAILSKSSAAIGDVIAAQRILPPDPSDRASAKAMGFVLAALLVERANLAVGSTSREDLIEAAALTENYLQWLNGRTLASDRLPARTRRAAENLNLTWLVEPISADSACVQRAQATIVLQRTAVSGEMMNIGDNKQPDVARLVAAADAMRNAERLLELQPLVARDAQPQIQQAHTWLLVARYAVDPQIKARAIIERQAALERADQAAAGCFCGWDRDEIARERAAESR